MKNSEKYKTTIERIAAHNRWTEKHDYCPNECPYTTSCRICFANWLELEAEEENKDDEEL